MKILARYSFALLLCLGWIPSWGQRINIRNYNVEKGLPQDQVLACLRDDTGYIWVGTYSGLTRYNGREWTIYTRSDDLPGNQVSALLNDSQGRLWVGTYGRGVTRYESGTFHNPDPTSLLGASHVNTMLEDHRGRIWVGTRQGILIMEGDDYKIIDSTKGLPQNRCTSLLRDGRLIYAGTHGGVVVIADDQVRQLPFSSFFQDHVVQSLTLDDYDRLWLGTDRGLYVVEDNQPQLWSGPAHLAGASINTGLAMPDGSLWFGTLEHGAFKIVDDLLARELNPANGLPNATVYNFVYDHEKNLWIGTDSGLCKYRPGEFEVLNKDHGLSNEFVRAFYLDNKDRIWVGTRDGAGIYHPDNRFEQLDTSTFINDRVYGIHGTPSGLILFATRGGLVTYQDGKIENYGVEQGLIQSELRTVFCDSRGMIWLGGFGLTRWDRNQFHRFPNEHPMGSARILDIVEDRMGRLWLGTSDGLIRYHPRTGETHFVEDAAVYIWDLELGDDDTLWFGTNGEGLWSLNGDEVTQYNRENGLTDDFVWQVLTDSEGNVWAGHNLGIDRLPGGKLDGLTNYTTSDGLARNEGSATAVVEGPNGRLWFGTSHGISRYTKQDVAEEPYPAKVIIESLVVNEERQNLEDGIVLERDENTVALGFAALSFVKEEKLEYSFLLDGLDSQWSPPGQRTDIKYASLRPKTYHFRVKARNADADWLGGETNFTFTVRPAFYETVWFKIGAFFAVLMFILVYIRLRVKQIEKRNQELEDLVEERTEALAKKGQEFKELSLSDPLTKLRNRRYVTEIMVEEMRRLKRGYFDFDASKPFTCLGVLLLDLDHFKSVNDVHGHNAGDYVIIETARRLKEAVRDSDIVARWGGEEFLVLLLDIKPEEIAPTANKVLEAIRVTPFDIGRGRQLDATSSAGYAYLHPSLVIRDVPWEWAFKLADRALYRSKHKGRDQAYGIEYNTDKPLENWYDIAMQDPDKCLEAEVLAYVSS